MNKFSNGDGAIIVNTPFPDLNGVEVTVTSNGQFMYNEWHLDGAIVYTVDIELLCLGACDMIGIAEPYLRPIYNGNKKTSWDDCEFKPSDLELIKVLKSLAEPMIDLEEDHD